MIDAINELLEKLNGKPTDELISALVTPLLAVIIEATPQEALQTRILDGVCESMKEMLPQVRQAIRECNQLH